MTRRISLAFAAALLALTAATACAQGASLAVGAAIPTGDFATTAGTGLDIDLQVRTQPMFGPVALRIDGGYDHFAGKGGVSWSTITTAAVSFIGDLGSMFYIAGGPGYYQTQVKTMILTHDVTESRELFGAQAALGMNVPVFRWRGFVEVGATKLFSSAPSVSYVPLRFGVRL
jgi:hypothetical protein